MKIIEAIVKRLGIIKNQMLIFAIMGSIVIFFFAKDLAASEIPDVASEGRKMFWAAIVLLFGAAGFYIFAWIRLPSSEQEVVFEREGKRMIRRHRASKERGARKQVPKIV